MKKQIIKFNCQKCNQYIEKRKGIVGKAKFCSSRCYWDSRKGKLVIPVQIGAKNGNWNPNKQSRTYPSQNMKSKVKERERNRCYVCWSTDKLHVHHAIPFKIEKKHRLENLITLCHDCHWKIHKKDYHLSSGISNTKYPNGRYAVWMFH